MDAWKEHIIDGLTLLKQGCKEAFDQDDMPCYNCPWVSPCAVIKKEEFFEPRKLDTDILREIHEES